MNIRNFAVVFVTGIVMATLGGCPAASQAPVGPETQADSVAPGAASVPRGEFVQDRRSAGERFGPARHQTAAAAATSSFHFLAPELIRLGEVGEVDSVATGDIDGDSRTDAVVVTNYVGTVGFGTSRKVLVLRQSPQGTLLAPDQIDYLEYPGQSPDVATGDFDGDGRADIIVGHLSGFTYIRYRPDHGYSAVVHYDQPCQFLALLDADQDGALDVVCNDGLHLNVYYGDGAGNFPRTSSIPLGQYGWQDTEAADVTGDGVPDLVLFCDDTHSELRVYPGVRGGGFSAAVIYPFPDNVGATGASPFGIITGDFNHDGRIDVALSMNESDYALYVMQQTAQGTLLAPVALSTYDVPLDMASADFDGDGDDDIVAHYGAAGAFAFLPQSGGQFGETMLHISPWGGGVPNNNVAVGDIDGDECLDYLFVDGYYLSTIKGADCRRKVRHTGGAAQVFPVH